MGTYDHVEIEIECPKCGKIVSDFQTKDGPRQFLYLRPGLTFDRWWMNKAELYKDYYNTGYLLTAYSKCKHCKHEIVVQFPLITVVSNTVMVGLEYEVTKFWKYLYD